MAKFLTTKMIASEIESLMRKTNGDLYLVSPYLKVSNEFLLRLKDADHQGVHIHIVYGKKELSQSEQEKLDQLKNISLYYYDSLHAKCYANSEKAILSSMNLYEFSEMNNREMGVLLEKSSEEETFQETLDEVLSIVRNAERISENTEEKVKLSNSSDLTPVVKEIKSLELKAPEFELVIDKSDEYIDYDTFHLPTILKYYRNKIKTLQSNLHIDEESDRIIFSINFDSSILNCITLDVDYRIYVEFNDPDIISAKAFYMAELRKDLFEHHLRLFDKKDHFYIYLPKGYAFDGTNRNINNTSRLMIVAINLMMNRLLGLVSDVKTGDVKVIENMW